jgi:hypothetical protein
MASPLSSQSLSSETLARELFSAHERHQLSEIKTRRFKHADLNRWTDSFAAKSVVEKTPAGQSAEGRTISLLRFGSGPINVLLWSQMHGDEPTATMALMDMLNFFLNAPDHPATRTIREHLTLLMIPMLNPDGAERFQRRTAQLIDMNRDALALQTPEARILKSAQQQYKPEFAFNLHDQDPRNTVGTTKKVAAIALLAPAADEAKTETPSRLRAKKLTALFAETMKLFIEGHVSRYDDTFEPRAFGDNVQKWGSSTVLVESGGWPNDREKMFLRKLNFVGLVTALHAIATKRYESVNVDSYEKLPFNMKLMFDLMIRNVQLQSNSSAPPISVDVGINLDEETDRNGSRLRLIGKVMDVGDLSTYSAFEEVDLKEKPVDASAIGLEKRLSEEEIRALLRKQE